MNFLKRLEEHRALEKKLSWEGTFADYLEVIKNNSFVCQLAHSRIYEMIKAAGVEETGGVKQYKFFASELFGLAKTLEKLVEEYFSPGRQTF